MLTINPKKALILIVLVISYASVLAIKPLISPQIINYSSEAYRGGTQNWGIDQDKQGIIYIANNDGLLAFNGHYWHIYKTPNLTSVRSVKVQENKIFVGAQDEFGYFEPNTSGTLEYHSLVHLVPKENKRFADIWSISFYEGGVLFRAKEVIFYYNKKSIKVFKPAFEWEYMDQVKNRVLAHSKKIGLVYFDGNKWEQFGKEPILAESVISSVIHLGNEEYLISTLKDGLFFFECREAKSKIYRNKYC